MPITPRLALVTVGVLAAGAASLPLIDAPPDGSYALIATNELGMHCMQDDYSEFCVLPPFNSIRAQLIQRGNPPHIVESGVEVRYTLPAQQRGVDQNNFWVHAEQTFGVDLPPGVGLAGTRTSGTMAATGHGIFEATGVPVLSVDDDGRLDPYPLALVSATGPLGTAYAPPVVPVSSEMSCSFCHGAEGGSIADSFLSAHDRLHATDLMNAKPVLCAACHADAALGAPGVKGVPNLSSAMHLSHALRVEKLGLDNSCYACHPGVRSQCQRDLHAARGVGCIDCHGDMTAVGSPARQPWIEEPRCGQCHEANAERQFEQPGKNFKESVGHGGVRCVTCHGSPHAMVEATTPIDNLQWNRIAGSAEPLNKCTTCHLGEPGGDFFHRTTP